MLLTVTCPVCGGPGPAPCPACVAALPAPPELPCPPGLDGCVALLAYHGPARPLVAALKFRGRRDLVAFVADRLAALATPPPGTVVTWAPTTPARRRARGIDQAEVLARALARRWRLPCRALLRRRPGPSQAGRGASRRWAHPGFESTRRAPATVVVVDDVATTGATVAAAGRALRSAGARVVVAAVAARTPASPPGGPGGIGTGGIGGWAASAAPG